MRMYRRKMIRVVSRVKVLEGLSCGSVVGFMCEVMLVWVKVWGVHVRLTTIGTMSVCVPCQCERSEFARGLYFFYDVVMDTLKVIVRATLPFTCMNFTNG
jgi:hypothetical protein